MTVNPFPRRMLATAIPARAGEIQAPAAHRLGHCPALEMVGRPCDSRAADYFEDLLDTILDAELRGTLRH